MVRTGEGTEEDRNNMIRAASITNGGGATILNMEGAGIFNKEGGARITNRNGRMTGTIVKEVKVTGSSTTIKDVTMTSIKERTEKGDKRVTEAEAMEAVEGMKTQWFFCPKNCHLYLGTELRKWDSK